MTVWEGSSAWYTHVNDMTLHIDSYSNIRAPNLHGVSGNSSIAGRGFPRAITSPLSLLRLLYFSESKTQKHKEWLLWLDWRELQNPLLSVPFLTLQSCLSCVTPLLLGMAPPFLIFHLSNVGSDSSPLPFTVLCLPHLFPPRLSAAGQGTIDRLLAYFM